MPTLVNYGGDDDFLPGCSNLMDSSLFFSFSPYVEVYCPRKKSRITAPFVFEGEVSNQEKVCTIDILPDECLFEIFRRLPYGQERSSCACVSKRWLMLQSSLRRSEIYNNPSLLEKNVSPSADSLENLDKTNEEEMGSDGYLTRCLEGKKATDIRLAAISIGTANRGGLGKLLIRGNNLTHGVTDRGLSTIGYGCPSLRVLSLWNLSSITDEGLSEIAQGCPLLEKIDLSHCEAISSKGLAAVVKNCPNLISLTIESCPKFGNESLLAFGQFCPNMKSITINNCPLVGDHCLASLMSSSTSLTKMKLEAVNISDMSLAVIGYYGKTLTDLSFANLHNVTERGFWALGNALGMLNLKFISISCCRGFTDLGLEALGKSCPDLKHMYLRKCLFVSDKGLRAFSEIAKSPEILHIEECNRITQVGILGALSNFRTKLKSLSLVKCMGIKDTALSLSVPHVSCKSLRTLCISNCPGFGAAGLVIVGKLCPYLQQIELNGLSSITDSGLLSLVEGCKLGLIKVNLSGCSNITDAAISTLIRLHGKTLQLVCLDGCPKITDQSLMAIAENCSLLRDLDVSKCSITDRGISALSSSAYLDIQILSLLGCARISDNSLPYFESLGRSLLGLNIQHCHLISKGAIDLLGARLWRCDILS